MGNEVNARSRWRIAAGFVAGVAALTLSAPGAVAQQGPANVAGTYRAPRTPDGRPDLQGYWTNLTYTPFERPKELAGKPFYTEQEAIDAFDKAVKDTFTTDQLVHYVQSDFAATPVQTGARPNLYTSVVIEPADGRIPAFTPEARRRVTVQAAAEKARGPLPSTWRDDRGTQWCVFHDRAVPSIPAPYGSIYHIVQSKDFIVMTYEWNSERRVIPLDGRPHNPASVRTYAGDARGRWEGDTLVVETTNFTPKRDFFGSEGTFTLVERFTRVSEDSIAHTLTISDPATWVSPWTLALPLHRTQGPMLEYACNENNMDAFTVLKNARAQERGELAAPDAMKRGDAKAVIKDASDKGAAEVIGSVD